MTALDENAAEQAALCWLRDIGWGVAQGPDIAPDEPEYSVQLDHEPGNAG